MIEETVITMKNNFTFLAEWFPTLVISSFVTALGSGILQMAVKFALPDHYRLQYLIGYCVLTVLICFSLGSVSAKLGKKLNRGSKSFSTGIPVFNMLICGAIYVILYIILQGRAFGIFHLFPCEMFIINGVFGPGGTVNASLFEKTTFCVLQFCIYIAVSLVLWLIAKKKQEGSETVKRLRGEKRTPNNRFGIDIDI